MRALLLVALMATIQKTSPPIEPKQPVVQDSNRKLDSDKTKEKKQGQPKELPTLGPIENKSNTQDQGQPGTQNSESGVYKVEVVSQPTSHAEPWFITSVIITGIIAIANLGVVGVMYWQRNVMQSQVEKMTEQLRLMGEQLRTAKISADALISIERPWIFQTSVFHQVENFAEGRTATAVWRFKNFGKTPAFILQVDGALDLVANPETDLPPEPIYRKPYRIFEEFFALAPNQESEAIGTAMSRPITREEEGDIWEGRLFLVFYGRIKYSSVFKGVEIGESRFCYQYVSAKRAGLNSGFIRLCGSSLYNSYT